MKTYNWQQDDWPNFTYSLHGLEEELFIFAEKAGRVSGKMLSLPEDTRQETLIHMMVAEAIKTSEIEGEYLSRKDVISSVRKNLGLHTTSKQIKDQRAAGVADLMIHVRKTWNETLTKETLFSWHRMLFESDEKIKAGAWRTDKEPMQVISGPIGKETVHYEAPPSAQVPNEMEKFINWFNNSAPKDGKGLKQGPVRSAVSHLYFESIHPFDDGNGRVGRALAEKALSQGMGRPVLLSLSETIESNKKAYYDSLKKAQRSNEITDWLHYFVGTLIAAQTQAEKLIDFTLQKATFFDRFRGRLNDRQLKVIHRMLEEGPDGFEGGMNARKYVGIAKISKATATRDLQYLLEIGAFKRIGDAGGRSTRYQVNL